MSSIVKSAKFSNDMIVSSAHYHDQHQILYVKSGEIEVKIKDSTFRVEAGSMICFSRIEEHSVSVLSEKYERYIIRIEPFVSDISYMESKIFFLLFNRTHNRSCVIKAGADAVAFERLFEKMIAELSCPSELSQNMLNLLSREMLIMIYRRDIRRFDALENENLDTVVRIQRLFESAPNVKYSLSYLSKEYNMSPSSLSHKFKEISGMSVMSYLLSCRIATAKRLLASSNLSVSEIVESCGFSDASNFSRTFKSITGLSPSDFRKKYKH